MTAQQFAIQTADWLLMKAGLPTYSALRDQRLDEIDYDAPPDADVLRRLMDSIAPARMDKESHLP